MAQWAARYPGGQSVVHLQALGGIEVARRVAQGEAADVVVLARDSIDTLVAQGHLRARFKPPPLLFLTHCCLCFPLLRFALPQQLV